MAKRISILVLLSLLVGCAQIPEDAGNNPKDPYEKLNRNVYAFNSALDSHFVSPIARGYKAITPDFIETRVSNASDNLLEPSYLLNNTLQGDTSSAIESGFRFLVNSTFGIFGMFDVANEIGIQKKGTNFGDTLAKWGVNQGSYIVLPFLGPSTTRDVWSYPVIWASDPTTYIFHNEPWWVSPTVIGARYIDLRARLFQLDSIKANTIDEYVAVRDAYLQYRAKETATDELSAQEELKTLTPLNFDEDN